MPKDTLLLPREYFLNLFGSDCHLYAWCVHMSGVGERDSLQCCNSDAVWFQVTWRAWPPRYRRISWPWRVKRRLGHILCHGWKLVPILDREHLLQHCIIMSLFERLLLTFDIHCTLYALSFCKPIIWLLSVDMLNLHFRSQNNGNRQYYVILRIDSSFWILLLSSNGFIW